MNLSETTIKKNLDLGRLAPEELENRITTKLDAMKVYDQTEYDVGASDALAWVLQLLNERG